MLNFNSSYMQILRKNIAYLLLNRNKEIVKNLKEFEISEFYNKEQIWDYQNKKFLKLIDFVYKNNIFYKKLYIQKGVKLNDIHSIDDISKLPIIEKADIQNNIHEIVDKSYKNKIYYRPTSGSTGNPLKIYYNEKSKFVEIALSLRFNKEMEFVPGEKQLLLWGGHSVNFYSMIKKTIKQILYNYKLVDTYALDEESLSKLAYQLVNEPPLNIRGYTSAVYLLASKMRDLGLKTNIKSISVTAEQLFDWQRQIIEENFGGKIYDQYGCGEINSLAFECSQHRGMHHAFEHSFLEILDENNNPTQKGDIVLTNFDNYVMPLIRYRNGDIASLSCEKCPCGRESVLIEKIEGRTYDFIKGINGKIAHGGLFDDILLESKFMLNNNIKQIRIIQTKINELVVEYVSDNIINEKDLNEAKNKYQSFLGEMKITFKKVDSINTTKTGKRKFIVSLDDFKKNRELYE